MNICSQGFYATFIRSNSFRSEVKVISIILNILLRKLFQQFQVRNMINEIRKLKNIIEVPTFSSITIFSVYLKSKNPTRFL